jgi:hypothetical protein
MEYKHPTSGLRDYDKFMIDPVIVHFAPNAKGTAIDPSKVKQLTDYAAAELHKSLSARYQVVSASGPGVLRLRLALTDIKKTTPAMSIHPATKLSGVGLGGASMEAEAIDSKTGERVLAVVDTRVGDRFAVSAGLDPLGHAKQVIRRWAERFLKRIDKAHGYAENQRRMNSIRCRDRSQGANGPTQTLEPRDESGITTYAYTRDSTESRRQSGVFAGNRRGAG